MRSYKLFLLVLSAVLYRVVDGRECEKPCQIQICSCSTPDVMDCSNRQLKQFSAGTRFNATGVRVLKLNNNELNAIPDLSRFTDLHTLDLSYNRISDIDPFSFISLPQLLHLNISFNDILLSNSTVSMESFEGLSSLRTLRMKQGYKPAMEFDYFVLVPLFMTLEELYITGTNQLSPSLELFSKLHTLSLGGAACHTPILTDQSMRSITRLPLKRFSARNCGVKEINREFLWSYRPTLLKLDLSCNHLRDYIAEITSGVEYSQLHTLLLDHINMQPDGDYCLWKFQNYQLAPLQQTPLKVLSVQANQIQAHTDLNLISYLPHLIYFDVSQNYFNRTSFSITPEGLLPYFDKLLFYNRNLQLPLLRYIGLQDLSDVAYCGRINPNLLDCDAESYLFTDDNFYWNHNYNPDIMDSQMLIDSLFEKRFAIIYQWYSGRLTKGSLIDMINYSVQRMDVKHVSNKMINKTIDFIWNELKDVTNPMDFIKSIKFFPSNVTTFAAGYNYFSVPDDSSEKFNKVCSDINMFLNNADRLELSYSSLGYIPCRNVKGFNHLSNFTCRYCKITGWHEDLFLDFPVKYFDLTGNRLGERLRDDMTGNAFGSTPGLERLYIGEQEGGIKYFNNSDILTYHPNLTHLDLHDNELASWNITISSNPQLTYLDLRDNKISYIEEKYRNEFDNQSELHEFTVDLAGNKVLCTDSNSDYIDWLLTSSSVACANEFVCTGSDIAVSDYWTADNTRMTGNITKATKDETNVSLIVVAILISVSVLVIFALGYYHRHALVYRLCSFHHLYHKMKKSDLNDHRKIHREFHVFASHTAPLTDKISRLVEEVHIADDSITITSREISLVPGYMLRASTAKLIAQSDRVVIFITPDYLKEDMTKFEFELIKMKKSDEMLVVTVGIDSASQMEHLPQMIKDIISERNHLTWPLGQCFKTGSSFKAFAQEFIMKLSANQPIYDLFNFLAKEKTSFTPCQRA